MKIKRVEELECWQEARAIVNSVYSVCRVNGFKKDHILNNQAKRSALSIMANIAEGFSRKGNKEFIQFLYIAKASATELQSHLYIALDQKYLNLEKFNELYRDLDKAQRKISNLIKYLNTRI